jgi:hypothetical protein
VTIHIPRVDHSHGSKRAVTGRKGAGKEPELTRNSLNSGLSSLVNVVGEAEDGKRLQITAPVPKERRKQCW